MFTSSPQTTAKENGGSARVKMVSLQWGALPALSDGHQVVTKALK